MITACVYFNTSVASSHNRSVTQLAAERVGSSLRFVFLHAAEPELKGCSGFVNVCF